MGFMKFTTWKRTSECDHLSLCHDFVERFSSRILSFQRHPKYLVFKDSFSRFQFEWIIFGTDIVEISKATHSYQFEGLMSLKQNSSILVLIYSCKNHMH